MGVPMVTLAGSHHASRMTASVLTTLGLTELVAGTTEQYVEIAGRLASNPEALAKLRRELRGRMQRSRCRDACLAGSR